MRGVELEVISNFDVTVFSELSTEHNLVVFIADFRTTKKTCDMKKNEFKVTSLCCKLLQRSRIAIEGIVVLKHVGCKKQNIFRAGLWINYGTNILFIIIT